MSDRRKVIGRDGEEYLTCREVISFLFDYLEDETAPERRREFERHLAICPSCLAYLRSYRETIRLSHAALCDDDTQAMEPPAELIAAILAAR